MQTTLSTISTVISERANKRYQSHERAQTQELVAILATHTKKSELQRRVFGQFLDSKIVVAGKQRSDEPGHSWCILSLVFGISAR